MTWALDRQSKLVIEVILGVIALLVLLAALAWHHMSGGKPVFEIGPRGQPPAKSPAETPPPPKERESSLAAPLAGRVFLRSVHGSAYHHK